MACASPASSSRTETGQAQVWGVDYGRRPPKIAARMHARATRFPPFDSLRAIAALSVVAYHAFYQAFLVGHAQHSPLVPYLARLNVGVVLLFCISAFLLYRPFVRARLRDDGVPAVGAYAWRRFLRIVRATGWR